MSTISTQPRSTTSSRKKGGSTKVFPDLNITEDGLRDSMTDDMALTQPVPDLDENHIYRLLAHSLTTGPLLDPQTSPWSMAEVEASWAAYKMQASVEHGGTISGTTIGADTMAIDIPPLARDELKDRITLLGRGRKNPRAAKELQQALKRGGSKLQVSPETAAFVYEELLDAQKVLTSPGMANDPTFAYHLLGIKQALKNMSQLRGNVAKGPASAILQMVNEARASFLDGAPLDLAEVQALVEAAAHVLRAKKGKCPEGGCVVKRGGSWRVVSNKTGKLWDADYDSKKDANDAIAAYHLRKKGVPPPA